MKIYISILLFLIVLPQGLVSQKQGNIWYFGRYAGLDFNSGSPNALLDGALSTEEGCATISDYNGKLLFYTDGITIWNKNHQVMANGNGLLGHSSSTQSGVIVPKPGYPNIYYVFTVSDKTEDNGFRYSIVDLSLNGGLGEVTQKNVLLSASCVEKITAVLHENGYYIWVVMHEWENNTFRAYLITPFGINGVENTAQGYPVYSSAGMVHEGDIFNKIGYLKASPDGSKLCLTVYESMAYEIFSFDNLTGKIELIVNISGEKYVYPYGVEFSSEGKKLYVSMMKDPSKIYQYDLSDNDPVRIKQSERLIARTDGDYFYAALQIGPDKKIYCARLNSPYLSVIEYPEENGINAVLNEDKVSLKGRLSMLGLPTFIQSFFNYKTKIKSNSPVCEGDTLTFEALYLYDAKYRWTGPRGFESDSIAFSLPGAAIDQSGTYYLTITFPEFEILDSVIVVVNQVPIVSAGEDMTICRGESVTMNGSVKGGSGDYEIIWQPSEGLSDSGMINPLASPLQSTTYYLTVNDKNGCSQYDTVNVTVNIPPVVKAGPDRTICSGDYTRIGEEITATNGVAAVYWYDRSGSLQGSQPQIDVSPAASTDYIQRVIDSAGCSSTDTVSVLVNSRPAIELGENILICSDTSAKIGNAATSGIAPYQYQWQPAKGLSSINEPFTIAKPDTTTTYFLTVTDLNGCTAKDSITIFRDSLLKSTLRIDCKLESAGVNTVINLPLRIEAPDYFFINGAKGFEAELRFNATVLKPVGFDYEALKIEGGYLYIKIRDSVTSSTTTNGVLFDMNFFTAVGNSRYTDIEIVDFKWTGSYCNPVTAAENGCVDIYNICGNFSIVLHPGAFVTFSVPEPVRAGSDIVVRMASNQAVIVKARLYDLLGNLAAETEKKLCHEGINNLIIPAEPPATGVYCLVLDTNYGTFTYKVILTY